MLEVYEQLTELLQLQCKIIQGLTRKVCEQESIVCGLLREEMGQPLKQSLNDKIE